jgi:hypothetical protein
MSEIAYPIDLDDHRQLYFLGPDLAASNGQIRYETSVGVFDDLSARSDFKLLAEDNRNSVAAYFMPPSLPLSERAFP